MKLADLPIALQDQVRAEFTVHGSCGCDGALDNGCPSCNEERLQEWVIQQATRGVPNSVTRPDLRGRYFPVLDHGFVALVDSMGDDAAIAEAARNSYGPGNKSIREDRSLIRYLYNHTHTSPYEMAEIKLHCKMPIFVARQWIRHRTANVNELSGRYSIMPLQFYTPERSVIRAQSKTNKQGRDAELSPDAMSRYLDSLSINRLSQKRSYISALRDDVARELSRIDLPLSLYTEWYWKIDLHNLLHFLKLRFDSHAQKEIQDYARVIAGIVQTLFPAAFEAWVDYSYAAAKFSRMERILLSRIIESGEYVTKGQAVDLGMTSREWDEFEAKLKYKEPDLAVELDLSKAKSAEHFRQQAKKYVPEVE